MKAATAYKTISEVSETLRLPAHVLRFWETKFPQIAPLKRSGGRRFYKPQDIDVIVRIRELLHVQGYTIRGVQQLLRTERLGRSTITTARSTPFDLPSVAPVISPGIQRAAMNSDITPKHPLESGAKSPSGGGGDDTYLQTLLRVRSTLQSIRDELDELQQQVSNRV
jgi:DNA-binding transcriptional MerR regulator